MSPPWRAGTSTACPTRCVRTTTLSECGVLNFYPISTLYSCAVLTPRTSSPIHPHDLLLAVPHPQLGAYYDGHTARRVLQSSLHVRSLIMVIVIVSYVGKGGCVIYLPPALSCAPSRMITHELHPHCTTHIHAHTPSYPPTISPTHTHSLHPSTLLPTHTTHTDTTHSNPFPPTPPHGQPQPRPGPGDLRGRLPRRRPP